MSQPTRLMKQSNMLPLIAVSGLVSPLRSIPGIPEFRLSYCSRLDFERLFLVSSACCIHSRQNVFRPTITTPTRLPGSGLCLGHLLLATSDEWHFSRHDRQKKHIRVEGQTGHVNHGSRNLLGIDGRFDHMLPFAWGTASLHRRGHRGRRRFQCRFGRTRCCISAHRGQWISSDR